MVKVSYLKSDHATEVQDRAWTILNGIFAMNQSLKNFSDDQLAHISLYGSEKFTCSVNAKLLRRTIKFLKATKHFSSLLLYYYYYVQNLMRALFVSIKLCVLFFFCFFCFLFFCNWDSLHARLNSHYEAWSSKKRSRKKDYRIQKICLERTYS